MRFAVTGSGVLCPDAVLSGEPELRDAAAEAYDEPLPSPPGHAVADFSIRERLGRKGTGFLNRAAGLTLVATGRAIENAELTVDDSNRARVGVVLGTTMGSFRSTADYTRETLRNPRPFLVNPGQFPNAVINGAASYAAIRYGLRGVNATVAGGPLGFVNALRYAVRTLRHGHADVLLTGAVEEFTPDTAWATHLASGGSESAGEGAAMFVVEPYDAVPRGGRQVLAEVLAAGNTYRPDLTDVPAALAGCLREALSRAGVTAADVAIAGTGETPADEAAVREVLGDGVTHLRLVPALGRCGAAAGALQLASALSAPEAAGRAVVLLGWTPDGAIGTAVLRVPAGSTTSEGE